MSHVTPYCDDKLEIKADTTPEEVRRFVERRVKDPYEFGDTRVWNFGNHIPNTGELEEMTKQDRLPMDGYMIPFQVSSVWCHMFQILPHNLRRKDWLIYSAGTGEYTVYPNFYRTGDSEADRKLRANLVTEI